MFTIDNTKSYCITYQDVYDVFCLPTHTKYKVGEVSDEETQPLVQKWKNEYGVTNEKLKKTEIRLNNLVDRMLSLKEGGDEFKRLFVMYAVSSFLDPTANRLADLRIAHAIEDVNKIRDFDWCSYVMDRLCFALQKKDGVKNVGGCLLLLEIVYFHRLKFKGESQPQDLPLIQHWTNEKVRKRIKDELAVKSFGNGELERDVYPICKFKIKQVFHTRTLPDNQPHQPPNEGTTKRVLMFELLDSLPSDEEISQLLIDEHEKVFLRLKRNVDVVSRIFNEQIVALKKNTTAEANESSNVSPTQKWFSDPVVQCQIDELVAKMIAVKEAAERPKFDLLSQDFSNAPSVGQDMQFNDISKLAQEVLNQAVELGDNEDIPKKKMSKKKSQKKTTGSDDDDEGIEGSIFYRKNSRTKNSDGTGSSVL